MRVLMAMLMIVVVTRVGRMKDDAMIGVIVIELGVASLWRS